MMAILYMNYSKDILEEHTVPYHVRQQILTMSRSGITHEKISHHLKSYHYHDKSESDLNDIILATHLEVGQTLPKGVDASNPMKRLKNKEKKKSKLEKRRRARQNN